MPADRISLSPAPHCEPLLENWAGDRRVVRALRRPATDSAPRGVRRAVRGACAPAEPVIDTGARKFADQALRLVLEIVDRRRPANHLRTLADHRVRALVHTVVTQDLAPGRTLGTATLTRVHLTPAEATAAELFASYQRGPRTFAIAGRIDLIKNSWTLTALRLY